MIPGTDLTSQEDKERLRAQLALASRGGSATEARLAEKEEYIASLQAEGEPRPRPGRPELPEMEMEAAVAMSCR